MAEGLLHSCGLKFKDAWAFAHSGAGFLGKPAASIELRE